MDPELLAVSTQLGELAVRNTARSIGDRIRAVKARRDDHETIAELEEIVESLLADKNELVRVARELEEELVAQRISGEDIEYVTENLLPVIESVAIQSSGSSRNEIESVVEGLKPVLSTETFTILQTLGFNFRRAIGEPLTQLVAHLILARTQPTVDTAQLAALQVRRDIVMAELAQNPEAFARLTRAFGVGASTNTP